MLIYSRHYNDKDARPLLIEVLRDAVGPEKRPLVLCLGSDRHLLDCFGPLTGTMLREYNVKMPVFGTLEKPLHATNLRHEIENIKKQFPCSFDIAIDASVGSEEEIGKINIRHGQLIPGKAIGKRLPPVGHLSITGLVGIRAKKNARSITFGTLCHVYNMARLLCEGIMGWELCICDKSGE